MRLPDFIIIGAPKAGTTWLAQRLHEHEDVCMPAPFEKRFFNVQQNYDKGLDWYADLFEEAEDGQLVGEKTPGYLRSRNPWAKQAPDVAERIHKVIPDAKLIVMLRNPVHRAMSAFHHQVRARRLSPWQSFNSLVEQFLNTGKDPHFIFSDGYYDAQIAAYTEHFPSDQILILTFDDDLVSAPEQMLDRVYRFLGLTAAVAPVSSNSGHENRGLHSRLARIINYYAPALYLPASLIDRVIPARHSDALSESVKKRIYAHYAPHNEALFKRLGRQIPTWLPENHERYPASEAS